MPENDDHIDPYREGQIEIDREGDPRAAAGQRDFCRRGDHRLNWLLATDFPQSDQRSRQKNCARCGAVILTLPPVQ